ncbi:MAG TPA: hypothetical protein VFL57_07735 [Bryobacteraceae bacterium]|nr:hypothetical protein [Bryobacteraceae bacterium]
MSEPRLGDVIDDYCVKCRRLTNHSIVSLMKGAVAKVRCRSCYHDHDYLREQAPPSKKDQKKAELFNAVLSSVDPAVAAEAEAVPHTPPAITAETAAEEPPQAASPAKKKTRAKRA